MGVTILHGYARWSRRATLLARRETVRKEEARVDKLSIYDKRQPVSMEYRKTSMCGLKHRVMALRAAKMKHFEIPPVGTHHPSSIISLKNLVWRELFWRSGPRRDHTKDHPRCIITVL